MTVDDDRPDPPAGEGAALPWDRAVAWLRGRRTDDPDPERTLAEACQDGRVAVLPGPRTLPTGGVVLSMLAARAYRRTILVPAAGLDAAFPPAPPDDARRKGGRKPAYPWDEIALCFGALLWDDRVSEDPEVQVVTIQKIARMLGSDRREDEPERGTVQPYRDRWLAAFAKWKRKDDAGN